MPEPFLLCDPGLLVPPTDDADVADFQGFWVRMVAWSTDRRVRLGQFGRDVILEQLGESWPAVTPPQCPQALVRDARLAIGRLLAAVAPLPQEGAIEGNVDCFSPAYVHNDELADSMALDVAQQHDCGLVGAATVPQHWAEDVRVVRAEPGPPDAMHLVVEPHLEVPGEVDHRVRRALRKRRVTVVGGRRRPALLRELADLFAVPGESVRWIEAESGREPNLGPLAGMQPEIEVLFCITGAIGHAASDRALSHAQSKGVRAVRVERPNLIVDELRRLFGT